jgi:radical SAM protein with 4Fe4S-binding SPASM domain
MLYWLKDKLSKSELLRKIFLILPDNIIRLHPLREIIIEPTNFCNLRCPFCINPIMRRKKGMMSLSDFEKLIELLPKSIKKITLHFAGEPFLNPDLPKMIKILKERKIEVRLSTNGTLSTEKYIQAIEAGLDLMLISLDGPTKEMHEKYRIGSNFEEILETIKKITKLPNRKTKIVIQFLVMRYNEKYIPQMVELCKNLGVDELWLKSTSFNIGADERLEKKILESAEKFLPENKRYCRYAIKGDRLINIDKPKICNWIWKTVILWNGDVDVCCTDLEGKVTVGNIFKEKSFKKIWKSKKYAEIRKAILRQDLQICKNCNMVNKPFVEKIKLR